MKPLNAVANHILSLVDTETGDSITNLKLQKLVYYAQAWSLALRGRPLFDDEIKAWQHGPVVPELWHRFRDYSYNAIDTAKELAKPDGRSEELSEDERAHIVEVFNAYGSMSAKQLEFMTHQDDPWIEARRTARPDDNSPLMSKDSITAFFSEKAADGA